MFAYASLPSKTREIAISTAANDIILAANRNPFTAAATIARGLLRNEIKKATVNRQLNEKDFKPSGFAPGYY